MVRVGVVVTLVLVAVGCGLNIEVPPDDRDAGEPPSDASDDDPLADDDAAPFDEERPGAGSVADPDTPAEPPPVDDGGNGSVPPSDDPPTEPAPDDGGSDDQGEPAGGDEPDDPLPDDGGSDAPPDAAAEPGPGDDDVPADGEAAPPPPPPVLGDPSDELPSEQPSGDDPPTDPPPGNDPPAPADVDDTPTDPPVCVGQLVSSGEGAFDLAIAADDCFAASDPLHPVSVVAPQPAPGADEDDVVAFAALCAAEQVCAPGAYHETCSLFVSFTNMRSKNDDACIAVADAEAALAACRASTCASALSPFSGRCVEEQAAVDGLTINAGRCLNAASGFGELLARGEACVAHDEESACAGSLRCEDGRCVDDERDVQAQLPFSAVTDVSEGDVDCFGFGTGGGHLRVETAGEHLDCGTADVGAYPFDFPSLLLLRGTEFVASDNPAFFSPCALLDLQVTEGAYTVCVGTTLGSRADDVELSVSLVESLR